MHTTNLGVPAVTQMRRREASDYLKTVWGIDRAPTTLAKLACIGGGPSFRHCHRTPLYPSDSLDDWAKSILSPLKSSTSDVRRGTK
jgi:hypothetical protein